jgi:hypothetical protein
MKYLRMPGCPWPVFSKPFIVLAHDNAAMAGVFAEVFASGAVQVVRLENSECLKHVETC